MSSTKLSAAHKAAAKEAVRPKSTGAKGNSATAAYKTPSFTKIVESYNKDGKGDREMLLALLQAKAKEDERLAALDLLKAEQLRAYSHHLAVHGPMMFHAYPQHQAYPPQQPYLPLPQQYDSAASSNTTTPSPQLSRSRASSSSSSSSATDIEQVRTPSDEVPKRMPAFHKADPSTSLLPPPCPASTNNGFAHALGQVEIPTLKRKRSVTNDEEEGERASSSSSGGRRPSPIVASRRASQVSLPSIASFHRSPPASVRELSPSSSSGKNASTPTSPSGNSLRHLLNGDSLRSIGNISSTRMQTSDLRSSGSSRDEAEEE